MSDLEFLNDQYCIVCGENNPIGFKVNFIREENRTYFNINIPKEFQGYKNVVHGGIVSTLLDEVMVHAGVSEGFINVTAELNVKYKKPVPVETNLVFEGKITEKKRRILLAEGRVFDDEGTVFSVSTGKLFITGNVE